MATATEELYKKYRPADFADVYGQAAAVKMLQNMVKEYIATKGKGGVPHAIMFVGDSGCGKTTLARIMAAKMRCHEADLEEVNASSARGIDEVREIVRRVGMSPMMGPCRIWIIDECHMMTTEAQNAILKVLEDTPKHVYFMLCTTNPTKLLKTVQNRCTQVKISKLTPEDVRKTINMVADLAGLNVSKDVADKIVAVADGSARRAVVALDAVKYIEDPEAALEMLSKGNYEAEGIEVARALNNPKTTWKEMAAILKANKTEPEGVRLIVLGYMNTMLCSGKTDDRAFGIIDAFSKPFFDNGATAYLTAACYKVICKK